MSLDFLRENNIDVTWDYPSMASEEMIYVTSSANAVRADIIKTMRAALVNAAAQGLTRTEAARVLVQKLKNNGLWDKVETVDPKTGDIKPIRGSSPYRVETFFRSNMQASYMSGKWINMYENRFDKPYLQYLTQADDRVRPSHAVLHKKVWAINDRVWNKIYPPNGYNCRCYVRQITEAMARRLGISTGAGEVPRDFVHGGFGHHVGKQRFNIMDAMGGRVGQMTTSQARDFLLGFIGSAEMVNYFNDFARERSDRDRGFVGYANPSVWPEETGKALWIKSTVLRNSGLSDAKKEKLPKALLKSRDIWTNESSVVILVSLGVLSNYYVEIKDGQIKSISKDFDEFGYEKV